MMNLLDMITVHPDAINILLDILFTEGSFNIFWTGALIILSTGLFYPIKDKWVFLVPLFILTVFLIFPFIFSFAYQYLVSRTTINRSLLQIIPAIVFICCILYENINKPGS